jgi:DNA invertase Pin-like site-specific DNA recombinase
LENLAENYLRIQSGAHHRGPRNDGLKINNNKVLTGALASVDPNTPDGRLMLQVVGAMAEFERSLIKDRTRAGLDAAREQGRTGGRPSVVSEDVLTVARARKAKGESATSIARALGISRATLYRHLGE